jgi:hypothetical protein
MGPEASLSCPLVPILGWMNPSPHVSKIRINVILLPTHMSSSSLAPYDFLTMNVLSMHSACPVHRSLLRLIILRKGKILLKLDRI